MNEDKEEENIPEWKWEDVALFFFYLVLFLSPWAVFAILGEWVARTILLFAVIIFFSYLAYLKDQKLKKK